MTKQIVIEKSMTDTRAVVDEAASILENLMLAVPRQTNDCDWWDDDLTRAMQHANDFLEKRKALRASAGAYNEIEKLRADLVFANDMREKMRKQYSQMMDERNMLQAKLDAATASVPDEKRQAALNFVRSAPYLYRSHCQDRLNAEDHNTTIVAALQSPAPSNAVRTLPNGWRPIETASHDIKDIILIYIDDWYSCQYGYRLAHYCDSGWWQTIGVEGQTFDPEDIIGWMPLPAAPKPENAASAAIKKIGKDGA